MVELLSSLQALLAQARHRSGAGGIGVGTHDLRQLVLVIADGRFHEKESLRRAVAVSFCPEAPWHRHGRVQQALD